MSKVAYCPTCNGKSKIKENKESGEISYSAIQDEAALRKIGQLKKSMTKAQKEARALTEELRALKAQYDIPQ